jgi:hypothetical protein
MAKNGVSDLRDHCFAQIERLVDPDCDLEEELRRADGVAKMTAQIIASGKLEVDYARAAADLRLPHTPSKLLAKG